MFGDTRYDRAPAQSVVDLELQELVRFGHLGTFEHCAYADIEFGEVVERDGVAYRGGTACGCFVRFFRIEQFLYLPVNNGIFELLEQQCGLAELMTGFEEIDRA